MARDLLHTIALLCLPSVGPVTARRLLTHLGSARAILEAPPERLARIPGLRQNADWIHARSEALRIAEREMGIMEREGIDAVLDDDPDFPTRLRHCPDAPLLLFRRGQTDLDAPRTLAVVGTRSYTHYGREATTRIVEDLATDDGLLVISGLAAGIDGTAHTACCDRHRANVAVFGTGLDEIYPTGHHRLAHRILDVGGAWLSEFPCGMPGLPANFPRRNRIVAGMADAVLVVESGATGGALITADIAQSYDRDVFAVPGRSIDRASVGCNRLIKTHVAALVETADDIRDAMSWGGAQRPPRQLPLLLADLTDDQESIVHLLREEARVDFETLRLRTGLATGALAAELIDLEMNGHVKMLPGRRYALV